MRLPGHLRIGIGSRLLLAFGAMALITVAASGIAWLIFGSINGALTEVTDKGVPAISLALQLTEASSRIAAAAPALDATTDQAAHDREFSSLQRELAELNKDFVELSLGDRQAAANLEQIRRLCSNIRTNLLSLDASVQDRLDLAKRTRQLKQDVLAAHEALIATLEPLVDRLSVGDELQRVSELRTSAKSMVGLFMAAASASEEGDIDAIRDRFAAELRNLQEVRAQVVGDDRYAAAIGAMDALAAFGTGDGDIFAARSDQMTAIASGRRTLGANRRLQRLLENEIDKIVATHRAEIARQASGAVSTIERGIGYLRAISAVSVAVAILIAWLYAGRNLTRRLRKLATNMRDLAAGNLEVAVPTGGSDEIASMADAMQIFKDNAIERRRLLDEQSQMAIRAQERAEAAFRRSERLFAEVFQASPDIVTLTTVDDGVFVDVNEAFLKRAERRRSEVVGHTARDLGILPGDAELRARLVGKIRRGELVHESCSLSFDADDEPRDYSVSAEIFKFEHQELLLTACRDVTEHRKQQEAGWRLQKLEALGTLAGGIAHDLNNTLVPILLLSELTAEDLPEGSRERQNLMTVVTASRRASSLVKQILVFSRQGKGEKTEVDLAALLEGSLGMLRASVPATIGIDMKIEKVPHLSADAGQMHQIIINLVTNAAHAIGTAMGSITVRLGPASEPPDIAFPEGETPAWICLLVGDTGCGIDEATMSRIFEPFFTTKGVGEGTGLGLSVVDGIVSSLGGRIDVKSAVDVGTTFTVYLPVRDDEDANVAPEAPVSLSAIPGGNRSPAGGLSEGLNDRVMA